MSEPPREGKPPRPKKANARLESLVETVRDLQHELVRQQKLLQGVLERVEAVDAKLGPPRALVAALVRQRAALDALLRAAYVDSERLPYPHRLTARRFGSYSQTEEDGLVLALLGEAGAAGGRFVELGCGVNGGNSGFPAYELGWSGLMVDGDEDAVRACRLKFPPQRVDVVCSWVTRDGIDDLLSEHGSTGEIDLLSIDIDGNDYWVWDALTAASPRLVVIEYNALFGPERSVIVPYDPDFDRDRSTTVEPRGANAFFLRDDVETEVPAVEPREAFRRILSPEILYELRDASARVDRALDPDAVFEELERLGLPLEEAE